MTQQPTAFLNARLIDPASRYDGPGAVLVRDGRIADVIQGGAPQGLSADAETVDCGGKVLSPGLIDLRVKTGEPGSETKETLASAARAAAAGGVTTFVVQPDTDPVIDDPSVADFILRRARDIDAARIFPAGAGTKGLGGERMAEIGLMQEAGCVYFTDADQPIVARPTVEAVGGCRGADQRVRAGPPEHVLDPAQPLLLGAPHPAPPEVGFDRAAGGLERGDVVGAGPAVEAVPARTSDHQIEAAGPAGDTVVARPAVDRVVVPGTTGQPVVARLPEDPVGARPAVDPVAAAPAVDGVVAAAAADPVVAAEAHDHVRARPGDDHVGGARPDDPRRVGDDRRRAAFAGRRRLAGAGGEGEEEGEKRGEGGEKARESQAGVDSTGT